jgi:ABC-type oligopeptide transport system substrate-binding subunit
MRIQIFIVLFFGGLAQSVAAELDIKEGTWEITSQVEMSAMPVKIPPVKVKQCFTKQSMTPEQILRNNNCQMQKMDVNNNSVTWEMSCQQQGMQMTGRGHLVYQKTSFSGNFDMTMEGGKEAMNIRTLLNGRYIGPCQ